MNKFLDTDHPFFKPLWIRVLIVAIAGGWGVFELASGAPFWAMIFLGIAAYSAWGFFIAFNPREEANPATKQGGDQTGAGPKT